MKFKNETKEDIVMPILNGNLPSGKLIIKEGETKDVPEQAIEYAKIYGLTPVDETSVEDTVVTADELEVDEAEEYSVSDTQVETKQLKSKKSKKRS